MSLFKSLQLCPSVQCPDDQENYDASSLHCARLESDNLKDYVIVTSLSGYISILQPSQTHNEDNKSNPPSQNKIIYESKFPEPILGVLTGNFVPSLQKSERQNINIAILHPKKLTICSFLKIKGTISEEGEQVKLQVLVEHELKGKSTAFCFCKGNFGGVKNKEFICVYFLDGSIEFFEQEGISHIHEFPGKRTIPSRITYIQRTDCLIFLSPNWDLECYRFINLSESFERKVTPIWSLNVGEYILDLNSHQVSNSETLIVLLGENNLICVSDTGKLRFIKKLDYTPMSFCSFCVGFYFESDCSLMIAITTENGSLLIYNEFTLVWCSELLSEQTVAIQRGNFTGLSGGLITLSANGVVSVGFLGSSPFIFKVPSLNLAKLDFTKSKAELEEMEKEINENFDSSDVDIINEETRNTINVTTVLESHEPGLFTLDINFAPICSLEQLQFFIFSRNPALMISKQDFYYANLKAQEKFELQVELKINDMSEEFSTNILTIMVSFINKQSIARAFKHQVDISPNLFLVKTSPQKEGLFKVNLTTSKVPFLADILEGFNVLETEQALGFKTLNSENVSTIILAKNSERCRIQANNVPSVSLILTLFDNYAKTSGNSKLFNVKTVPSSLIDLLITFAEKYYQTCQELREIEKNLETKGNEVRMFYRCFFSKIQEKNQAYYLDGIFLLLEETDESVAAMVNEIVQSTELLKKSFSQLQQVFYLISKIVGFSDLKEFTLLSNFFEHFPSSFHSNNWVEATASFIEYLHNLRQAKLNEAQFYENFSAHLHNFSMSKFKKQFKFLLSDDSEKSYKDDPENVLAEEETENEWCSVNV